MSQCPECDFDIELDSEPRRGNQLTCPNCHTRLVVLRLDPVELDWAFQPPLQPPAQPDEPEQPS